jgi:hypothetical protein
VADGVGGQSVTKEKPKRRYFEALNASVPPSNPGSQNKRAGKLGLSRTICIVHLRTPASKSIMSLYSVVGNVCGSDGFTALQSLCMSGSFPVFLIELSLTPESLYALRVAGDSPASPRNRS